MCTYNICMDVFVLITELTEDIEQIYRTIDGITNSAKETSRKEKTMCGKVVLNTIICNVNVEHYDRHEILLL